MVDQQEQSGVAVRHSIVVEAPPDRAFTVFTQRMQSWWPMESHRIGGKPITDLVTEPHAGGRWYERAEDGSECDWGRVVAWEPPRARRPHVAGLARLEARAGDPHGDRGPLHARGRRPHAGRPRAPRARQLRRPRRGDAGHLRVRARLAGSSALRPGREALALEDRSVLDAQPAVAVVLDGDRPAHHHVRAERDVALDRQAVARDERRRAGRGSAPRSRPAACSARRRGRRAARRRGPPPSCDPRVVGEHVGVRAQGEQVVVVFTGANRRRGTRSARAPSKTSIAAPIAVSSWTTVGRGLVRRVDGLAVDDHRQAEHAVALVEQRRASARRSTHSVFVLK